jgi:hypothetical protein
MRGTGEDEGKWYKCWFCGFPCKVGRDELGGSNSSSGVSHTDTYTQVFGALDSADPLNAVVCLGDDINHYHVALEADADGEPKTIRRLYESDISVGCPNCGSTNWRGDY